MDYADMKITVHLYSPLKEMTGTADLYLSLPAPATAADLLDRLGERFPSTIPFLKNAQLVINDQVAFHLHLVNNGDEVSIRLPVFGG